MHNFLYSRGFKSFLLGITPFTDMVSRGETLQSKFENHTAQKSVSAGRKSLSRVQGRSPGRGSGDEVPQKLKHCC